ILSFATDNLGYRYSGHAGDGFSHIIAGNSDWFTGFMGGFQFFYLVIDLAGLLFLTGGLFIIFGIYRIFNAVINQFQFFLQLAHFRWCFTLVYPQVGGRFIEQINSLIWHITVINVAAGKLDR